MANAKHFLAAAVGSASLFLLAPSFAGGPECPAPAPTPSGIIVGFQGGLTLSHWSDIDQNGFRASDIVVEKDAAFSPRPYVGYQFNRYIALELGWIYLPQSKFSLWNAYGPNNFPLASVSNWAADASLRLSMPVSDLMGFPMGLFSRFGLDYLSSRGTVEWMRTTLNATNPFPVLHNVGAVNVTFGFGAYCDLTSHLRAELSWTQFRGHVRVNNSYQPTPDFYSAGLSYRF